MLIQTSGKIRGVIFDWTGVLVDEIEATGKAHIAVIKKLGGRKITFEEWLTTINSDWRSFYIHCGVSPKLLNRALDCFKTEYNNFASLVHPYPGVLEMLRNLKQRGFIVAVVSSQTRKVIIQSASKHNLISYFDEIVAYEDVSPPKPDAEALRYVLRKLKLEPSETLYLDDMEDGIRMGLEAGVITIGVSSAFNHDLSRADFQIDQASFLINYLEESYLKYELKRPTTLATIENRKFIEKRYSKKIYGDISRMSSWYHADNIAFAKEIISWGIIPDQAAIADIGCGLSIYTQFILRKYLGYSIQIDLSHAALVQARFELEVSNYRLSCFPINADSACLPIIDSVFDIALCSEMLEHVVDDRITIEEINRVLKPEGYLIISVPNNLKCTFPMFRRLQKQFDLSGHVREYTFEEMRKLLHSKNFNLIKNRFSSFFIYWLVFSIERSHFAKPIMKFLERHIMITKLMRGVLAWAIFIENRMLGGWANFGMCSIYLAQKISAKQKL